MFSVFVFFDSKQKIRVGLLGCLSSEGPLGNDLETG